MSAAKERYPGQHKLYEDNHAHGDYEAILGQSKLNVTSIDEYMRLTQPKAASGGCQPPGSEGEVAREGDEKPAEDVAREGDEKQDEDVAREGEAPAEAGDDPNAKPGAAGKRRKRTPRCTGKEVLRRQEIILRMLEEGFTNEQIYKSCATLFGIERRMAQMYLKKVKRKLALAASKRDHLAHLELSKRQHDLIYSKALADLKKIDEPTKTAGLLRVILAILKNRDGVQEDIRHHRLVTRRDESPDSKAAKLKRQDMLSMPISEFFERAENMRNLWWWEFMQHYPQFLERQEGVRAGGPYDPKTFELFMRASYERWAQEKAEVEGLFKGGHERANQNPMQEEGVDQVLRDLANGKKI